MPLEDRSNNVRKVVLQEIYELEDATEDFNELVIKNCIYDSLKAELISKDDKDFKEKVYKMLEDSDIVVLPYISVDSIIQNILKEI
jgi:SAM-dependent MidA family methyltransferase